MSKLFLSCCCLFISGIASAQEKPLILDGKIGNYPIVMELIVYEDTLCDIRYFYLNQRKDIRLEGTVAKNGGIKAATRDLGDSKMPAEKMSLKKTPTGYSGTWMGNKKSLAITLKQTSAARFTSPYAFLPGIKELKEESPFDYIRTTGFVFTKEPIQKDQPAETEWYKEKFSGIKMPRLKSGYDSIVLKKINAVLLEKHLMESKNMLECTGFPYGEYEFNVANLFIHKNIFSMNRTVGYYCGGAHPDFASEGLSFDGYTGELLDLDHILWFDKTKPPEKNSDAWYEYRDNVFAPKVVELFKKLYPGEMKKPAESDTETVSWNFPNWYFTKQGLYLGAVFARVARVCDSPEWSVIPYASLQSFLNPESKLKWPE
jgi:hypothetical protein